ncbi:MAG: type II toxin-antitoxin system prevent-host-death family antitoxin [Chloroflexota bacterium]|nr:type II toxin-antitoxin system prevent-host-death family antitoxin [Chloroflexota bacterium]
MQAVGVRELKEHASEILRRVREGRETIEVTYRGKVVARLVPVAPAESPGLSDPSETAAIWASIDELAEKISARWPEGVSAADAISEDRREL